MFKFKAINTMKRIGSTKEVSIADQKYCIATLSYSEKPSALEQPTFFQKKNEEN